MEETAIMVHKKLVKPEFKPPLPNAEALLKKIVAMANSRRNLKRNLPSSSRCLK